MGQFKTSREEKIVLASGHSLILGHMPDKIPKTKYEDIDIQFGDSTNFGLYNFGFFGGPDYNNFYPGLTKEDFTPKDDDYIKPTFRLLSEVIVNKKYNPVDFSVGGVLKASMPLMIGQSVTPDHNTDVGDHIGAVVDTFWQKETEQNGLIVPAGMNGVLKIDAKSNPRLARAILMDPPAIHSNSVSVNLKWDKSHPSLDNSEFWNKLGTYDEYGELVRKICTEIVCYYHTSLVGHGADPFAKKVTDGNIANPEHVAKQDYSEETPEVSYYVISYKDKADRMTKNNTMVYNMKAEDSNPINNNKQKSNMNEELLKFLQSLFGTGMLTLAEGKTPTEEMAKDLIKGLVTTNENLSSEVTTKQSKIDELNTEVEKLKNSVKENENMVELGKTFLTESRNRVTELYKKIKGEDAEDVMIATFSNLDPKQLASFEKDYNLQLDKMFPLQCSDCSSHNVGRSSTVHTEEGKDEGKKEETTNSDFSNSSVVSDLVKKKKPTLKFD